VTHLHKAVARTGVDFRFRPRVLKRAEVVEFHPFTEIDTVFLEKMNTEYAMCSSTKSVIFVPPNCQFPLNALGHCRNYPAKKLRGPALNWLSKLLKVRLKQICLQVPKVSHILCNIGIIFATF